MYALKMWHSFYRGMLGGLDLKESHRQALRRNFLLIGELAEFRYECLE
ncbi:MAG: hypothetical protein ABJO27_02095 [Pseudoruegeria sp.]